MRLLLDTCVFLWWSEGADDIPASVRALVSDRRNTVFLSAISVWEIVLKHALGRLPLPDAPERFVPREREGHGLTPLPLDEASTFQLSRLPQLHRDPIDRMLIAQAIEHGLAVVTPDRLITRYPVRTIWDTTPVVS